jgi:hypothetical protein
LVFTLLRDQWLVTKGIREIAIMGERDGLLRPEKREDTVKGILECSRDLGIFRKGAPPHEQVMIAAMAFFGIAAGPTALSDAARWASEYANRHNQREVLGLCMGTATDLIEAAKQAEGTK